MKCVKCGYDNKGMHCKNCGHIAEYSEYCSSAIFRDMNKEITVLKGILKGINIDGIINTNEIDELENWCKLNGVLHKMEPYCSIITTLEECLSDKMITQDEYDDIVWACESVVEKAGNENTKTTTNGQPVSVAYDFTTQALQELQGIFHGIIADDVISESEIINLRTWIKEHTFLKSTYPYDEIESIVTSVLSDGVVTYDEKQVLKTFMGMFIDTKTSLHIHDADLQNLKKQYDIGYVCSVNPEITIEGKRFCFTGISRTMKRDDIADIIFNGDGIYSDSISEKTNFLVYGDEGSPCWAYTCYGRKVEQAMKLRKAGVPIIIIHESDFFNAISTLSVSQPLSKPVHQYTLNEAINLIESNAPKESQIFIKNFLWMNIYRDQEEQVLKGTDIDISTLIKIGIFVADTDEKRIMKAVGRNELNKRITSVTSLEFAKNKKLDDLVDWCYEHIPNEIPKLIKNVYVLKLNKSFNKCKNKLNSHFNKKFYENDPKTEEYLQSLLA